MEESMKDRFEIWAKTKELDLEPYSNPAFPEFQYHDIEAQILWECWQAAEKAGVEAELNRLMAMSPAI